MRIAVLSAAKSIHTIRWVNALAARGHMVALFSLKSHQAPEGVVDSRVEIHYIRKSGSMGYWFGAGQLRRGLRAFGPDILNAHYATGYGTLARRSRFKPMLLSVWGSDVYEFPYAGRIHKRIVQKNIDAATALASTSKAMANQVGNVYPREKKIFITPFGVETDKFMPRKSVESDAVTIGLVKTLEPKYGVEYLLRAMSLLAKRLERENLMPTGGLKLDIYGEGSQLAFLRSLATELGIHELTTFHGYVPHAQVPEVLAGFDIFCSPSISDSESFGVAAVEAMACGVPVVVSDVDGYREVVRDRVTGFVVKRQDFVTLSNRLYDLCRSPELRRTMGEAGREHVKTHYEWADCVTQMEKALENTLALSKGKGARP